MNNRDDGARGACAGSRNKPVWKCRDDAGNDEFVFAYARRRESNGDAPRGRGGGLPHTRVIMATERFPDRRAAHVPFVMRVMSSAPNDAFPRAVRPLTPDIDNEADEEIMLSSS